MGEPIIALGMCATLPRVETHALTVIRVDVTSWPNFGSIEQSIFVVEPVVVQ